VFNPAHRFAVRQSEKEQIARLQLVRQTELQRRLTSQVGMCEMDKAACLPIRCHLGDFDLWVGQQKAKKLAASEPRTAYD
jgi:hypothetical protein